MDDVDYKYRDKHSMLKKLLSIIVLGSAVRYWVFHSSLADWLAERPEVATPLTSWKRTTEGLALLKNKISPYTGDIYHEPPLILRLFGLFCHYAQGRTDILFIALDAVLAVILWQISKHLGQYLLRQQAGDAKSYHVSARKIVLRSDSLRLNMLYTVAVHMFSPFAIASCVAQSTAVLTNITTALSLLFALRGNRLFACGFLAMSAYQSLYPIMLVVPLALLLADSDSRRAATEKVKNSVVLFSTAIVQTVVCTVSALALLLYFSSSVENSSWDYLRSTYWFILSVPELTPNIGLFWYFFTEMFDHFRIFFLCVFQIHAFIYVVPLTIKLSHRPVFLFYILLSLQAIFKSYPSYADVAIYISMLPMWHHIISCMRNSFIVGVMLCVGVVLAPVLWHLWIVTGTANANFYFAITLVIMTSQIFLVTDILFAFLRREYDLFNGTKKPVVDGKPAAIILD